MADHPGADRRSFRAGLYSKILLTPIYKSTAMVYVLSKETTLTSLADLQIGSQLTKDYSVLVTSRPVLEQVIEKQQLDMRVDELERMISIGNPTDTRVLTITISDTDPIRAQALAEEGGKDFFRLHRRYYGNGSAQDHRGRRTGRKTKFSKCEKNAAMGGLAAAVLISGIICLGVIMDDTIKTEEDVEKYLGLTVLASIPDVDETGKSENEKGRKRRKRRERCKNGDETGIKKYGTK